MPPKIAPLVVAIVLAACSRGEPETKPGRSASAPVPAPAAPSVPEQKAAVGAYAPSAELKERLARQEAASKLLDAPTPPRAPQPAPKPLAAAKPPPAPPPARVNVEPARAPPAVNVAAAPSPPPAPPKSEPAKPEAAPRTEVALAKPAAPTPVTRLLHRVEPEFPREALKAGANEGIVQVRLSIDAGGNVTRVEVVEAKPRRLFDRAVTRALSEWKYSAGAPDRTVEVEIAFSAR